jgi:hypothetical protein
MPLFKPRHFTIRTKLSLDEIHQRRLQNHPTQAFDVNIYVNIDAGKRFAEQKLREALSINGVPGIKTSSFHLYKGEFKPQADHNEIEIKIQAGFPKILFFMVWGGFSVLGCLASILTVIFMPMNEIEPSKIPLLILPFAFLMVGYLLIQWNIKKDVHMAVEYFNRLFDGF